jgi:hypothetical protein
MTARQLLFAFAATYASACYCIHVCVRMLLMSYTAACGHVCVPMLLIHVCVRMLLMS